MSGSASRRAVTGLLVLVLLMGLPAVAWASPDGTSPSLDQYVENVPTASGDRPRPGSGDGSSGGQLPASTRRRIQQQGGTDAAALEAVAGSPVLGAPAAPKGSRDKARGSSSPAPAAAQAAPSAVHAAAQAALGGDAGTGRWLLAGVLLVTGVAAGAALIRLRGRAD